MKSSVLHAVLKSPETCHCISSHEHFISLHGTACHFEVQNSWFSKFSIQIRVFNFFKIDFKPPGSSKLPILPILPPGLWISKDFLRKTIWIVFNMDFQILSTGSALPEEGDEALNLAILSQILPFCQQFQISFFYKIALIGATSFQIFAIRPSLFLIC